MGDMWGWIKQHPYISAGAGVSALVLIWLLWPSSSGASGTAQQQNAQQLAMQRLTGNQQLQALRIQGAPQLKSIAAGQRVSLAQVASQNQAQNWQGRLGLAGLGEQTTLANIQAAEQQQQLQSQNYVTETQAQNTGMMAYMQYLIALMTGGKAPGWGNEELNGPNGTGWNFNYPPPPNYGGGQVSAAP